MLWEDKVVTFTRYVYWMGIDGRGYVDDKRMQVVMVEIETERERNWGL